MENRSKRNFKFFLFLIVLCLLAFGGAMLLKNDDNSLAELLENLGDDSFKDNYNGVYTYDDDLNGSKTLFRSCILSKISNHILVINDNYYLYRSSCVGTFFLGEGKTKDLNILVNKERKSYYIKYKDKVYFKNPGVTSIEVGNRFIGYESQFPLKDYQLLFKETQFPNNYFDVGPYEIEGLSSHLRIEFKHIENESFKIIIYANDWKELYSYTFKDFDSMPYFYSYGAYLVVIEKDSSETKYANKFKVIGEKGVLYNLDDKFPIIVDDVKLDLSKSIYVTFNPVDMDFRLIVSDDKKLCYKDETSEDIAYYEFMIDYNYATKAFEKPEYVKRYYKNDNCVRINELMGG